MDEAPQLPNRMFAAGEEPVGIRVTAYGASSEIRAILNVMGEDEKAIIRGSSFGKFISIADQPAFSGRFGRFIISRLLNVNKKHEIWVLFAGNPVRFSLREFAIVTGLPCGKYPKKSKSWLINNLNATPYWPKLFGKLDSVSVASVIKMLKRNTVTYQNTRIKYACLALLSSVLMPTTHHPKIVKDHVEEIEDLEAFFLYPWGRLAFEMLISSIKEKNEITLSQNTIALKGFVHALHLVMVEVVPALLEIVQVNSTSASESEGEGDEGGRERTICLSPAHARDLHEEETTIVDCIIPGDGETELDEKDLAWSDDEADDKVDTMLRLINEDIAFCSSMFSGGATTTDVARMSKEAKEKNAKGKEKRGSRNTEVRGMRSGGSVGVGSPVMDVEEIGVMVASKVKEDINRLEAKINETRDKLEEVKSETCHKLEEVRAAMSLMQTDISKELTQQIVKMNSDLIDNITICFDKCVKLLVHQNHEFERGNVHSAANKDAHVNVSGDKSNENKVSLLSDQDADAIIAGVLGDLLPISMDFVVGSGRGSLRNGLGFTSEVGDSTIPLYDVDNVDDVDAEGCEAAYVSCQFQKDYECPSFSLGLSQEEGGRVIHKRFSKRQKTLPACHLQDFQLPKWVLHGSRQGLLIERFDGNVEDYNAKFRKLLDKIKNVQNLTFGGVKVPTKEFVDVCGRTKFMEAKIDVLIHHTRALLRKPGFQLANKTEFFDSKFVSTLLKNYTKFGKMGDKELHKFERMS